MAHGAPGAAAPTSEQTPHLSRLLDLARGHLTMDVALMSQFVDGRQVVRVTSGDAAGMKIARGQASPFESSYCSRVLAGTLEPFVPEARRHPVTRDLPVTHQIGIGSYVGVPWRGTSGQVEGMLCCLSRAATPELGERAVTFLQPIAELVSDHLCRTGDLGPRITSEAADRIQLVLESRAIRTVFQPVVALQTGEPVAYEALSRFDCAVFPTPDIAFAAAGHAGLGAELELLAVERAFERLDDVPPATWLGVNLSPEALLRPEVQDAVLRHAHRNVGVEITEHNQVSDYDCLNDVVRLLRREGVQIVVDDAGAGFASLRHILRLRPDVIKLDIELVRGIDTDPVRQALTRSLASFAGDIGAHLVAEGIETPGELDQLRALGVLLGQGFLFARPADLPSRTVRAHRPAPAPSLVRGVTATTPSSAGRPSA